MTELYSVTGIAKWARVFERNKDTKFEDDGVYSISVVLDKEELDKVTKSGSRLKPVLSDDGVEIKFRRKHTHPAIKAFGGPPKVVDADNKPWDEEVSLGNGSKVELFYTVFETPKGKGTRLEGIRVIEHMEWEGNSKPEGDVGLPF